jgi:hypothetical protein
MQAEPFNQDYSVQLSGTGAGSVSFGPNRIGQSWTGPMTVAVKTSTANLVPMAEVFLDTVSLGSTYVGSGDSNDLPNVTVHVGQKIRVAWTGGDAGAVATASLTCTLNRW